VHSTDPTTILDFGAACNVLRVSVNVGNSLGSAGVETHLPPSMTIGTGYAGRSSVGENLRPDHLVNWVRLAHNADVSVPMGDFTGLSPWRASTGPVPAYPIPSNARADRGDHVRRDRPAATTPMPTTQGDDGDLREELRRIIVEELHDLIGGGARG
jgi:hypothetical protein